MIYKSKIMPDYRKNEGDLILVNANILHLSKM